MDDVVPDRSPKRQRVEEGAQAPNTGVVDPTTNTGAPGDGAAAKSKPRKKKGSPFDDCPTGTGLKLEKPKKSDYRQRAHCNPLSDFLAPAPITPDHVDWSKHYPEICEIAATHVFRAGEPETSTGQSNVSSPGAGERSALMKQIHDEVSLRRWDQESRGVIQVQNEETAKNAMDVDAIGPGESENSSPAADAAETTNALHPQSNKKVFAKKTENPPQAQTGLYLNTYDYPISYAAKKLHLDNESIPETSPAAAAPLQLRGSILNNRSGLCNVDFLDLGCGFGGLTVALAEAFPDKLSLGLEIREQVTNYVGLRILAMRQEYREKLAALKEGTKTGAEQSLPHHFYNCSVIRTNAMKTMPQYFRKGQLEKMFFCFPDPHFKKKNFRRRIVNDSLLSIYAYHLKTGGRIYCITDVKELHDWMYGCLHQHPLFREIEKEPDTEKAFARDKCVELIHTTTEEGKKVKNVGRFGHLMHYCVFEKIDSSN